MSSRVAHIALSVILMLGAVGCASDTPDTASNDMPTATSTKSTEGSLPHDTVAAETTVPASSSSGDIAAPYEEIRQEIDRIVGGPGGPQVGQDGIVDPNIQKALSSYAGSLSGKRVEGWQGLYRGSTQVHDYYNVSITMSNTIAPDSLADVAIFHVPYAQVQILEATKDYVGEHLVFTGTIAGLESFGSIDIEYASIAIGR